MTGIWKCCAIVAVVALSGCSTGIKRSNYRMAQENKESSPQACRIAIQYKAKYNLDEVEVLGQIKAYDTGVAVICDEAYVLEVICADACVLGADIVNIIEEKQPDQWSTCYRAKAEFLRFKLRGRAKNIQSDAAYAPQFIILRSEASAQRNKEKITAAVMGGILGGAAGSIVGAAAAGR